MSDVQAMAAMVIDRANESAEGQPQQLLLQGNPEVESEMASLEGLGVRRFTVLVRSRDGDDADVFATMPELRSSGRFSAKRVAAIERAQRRLGQLVREAVLAALVGTDAEDRLVFVEAVVVLSKDGGNRGITAYATVISTDADGGFCDQPIELL